MPRVFVCEAPGAPADPLGRWWWANNCPPMTIHSREYERRGAMWTVFCRVCERQIRYRKVWQSAMTAALQHLAWHARSGATP